MASTLTTTTAEHPHDDGVRLARPLSELDTHYDVVIVGSGYGGSVAASRLARAGKRVAVLERGKEFPTGSFPDRFPDLRREMRVAGGPVPIGNVSGLFQVKIGADMHVLTGCGLGGGSLINAGVALQPDERVFDDPVWPGQLRQDGLLGRGYEVARQWLKPAVDPRAEKRTKLKAMNREAEEIDDLPAPDPAEVVISFDAGTSAGGRMQSACTACGDCCAGCNVGAKNTLAMTYLPDAADHGAELFTGVLTTHISRNDDAWQLHIAASDGKRASEHPPHDAVTADQVVLAAGTLGSTEILLRSREHGLGLSDRLGQGFSANGDIIAFGMGGDVPVSAIGIGEPAKAPIDPPGAAVSGQIRVTDEDDLDRQMYIQEGAMPSAVGPLLPVFFLPGGKLLGAAAALIKGVYQGALQNLHTYFVVGHDSAAGTLALKNDQLELSWPDAESEPVNARTDAALTSLVEAGGGKYVKSPLAATSVGSKPATAHPLGGCAMGADSATGVVNHKGQVFDAGAVADTSVHDGLYVIDGSVIARSLGCNPLLTITAFAERAMMHMAADQGWVYQPEIRAGGKAIETERLTAAE